MTTTIIPRGGWLGWLIVPLLLSLCTAPAAAQNDAPETACNPTQGLPVSTGEVYLNYGAVTNSFSLQNRSSYSVGQPIVTRMLGQQNLSEGGYWARFLLPPQAPTVRATQGDFADRIQISWNLDPLSAAASRGYILTRDGNFLAELEPGTSNFIDFNVQPGEYYEYNVQGRNGFGTGSPGVSVGFTNPNGVVSGRVTSRQGNPILGTTVTLEPSIGRSLRFAGEDDYVCLSHDPRIDVASFTFSTYVRLDPGSEGGMIIDRGRDLDRNFWVQASAGASDASLNIGLGSSGGSREFEVALPADNLLGWNHLAIVYSGGTALAYVNGEFAASMTAPIEYQPALFTFGRDRNGFNNFSGAIDDVRIYAKPLTQTEIMLTKDITASRASDGLVAYWKFDEGIGEKVFDTGGGDLDGSLYGNTTFSSDAAPVRNGAITDEGGYYSIDGINYSGQESFTVRPSQNFYDHTSLEFNAARSSEVQLPQIAWPDSATLELTVRPFVREGLQVIAHAQQDYLTLSINNGTLQIYTPSGGVVQLGELPQDRFNHLAFHFDGPNQTITWFLNGEPMATVSGGLPVGSQPSAWTIGNHSVNPNEHFTGLIGEFALFDTLISETQLQIHSSPLSGDGAESGINSGDGNLVAFYPFDEGNGDLVEDFGPNAIEDGTITAATFSVNDYRQRATPHEYRPSERVVNLNGSNTAIGNIDFTDESTIPVSGVVRFSNTFCYQDSVQILANGFPMSPPVFTDKQGRWSAEFAPGASVSLAPDYPDSTGAHTFSPPFYELRTISRPISGVLFQNTVKRRVAGQVAGGECRLSINDPESPIEVKVESLNGCYSEIIKINNLDGRFAFTQVPPIPVAVSVIKVLPTFGSLLANGGEETDLRQLRSDTIDFIYTAAPQVEISPFPLRPIGGSCGQELAYIESSYDENVNKRYTSRIRVYEQYIRNQRCYLSDSLVLRIDNEIADAPVFDTIVRDTNVFVYRYPAGIPNFAGNNLKRMTVTATNRTGSASEQVEVVVTGRKTREGTFTTTDPQFPLYILRAPPGDQSTATLATGSTVCNKITKGGVIVQENVLTTEVKMSPKVKTNVGAPGFTVTTTVDAGSETKLKITNTNTYTTEHEAELCVTFDRTVSTASGEDVPHSEGDGDVYIGIAANINIDNNDVLYIDTTTCSVRDDSTELTYDIATYDTEYFYSQWQLKTDVIPALRELGNARDSAAADRWEEIIRKNDQDKESGVLVKNYTFDGLVSIEESTGNAENYSHSHSGEIALTSEFAQTAGITINSAGTKLKYSMNIGGSATIGGTDSGDTTTSVSFVLADDDPNDNFTVDILKGSMYPAPIFKLKAGESMCPWEPGTRNREEVGFNIDRTVALNVPETQQAVFKLQLTNEGQTRADQLVYGVGVVAGSAEGATVRLDGTTLNSRPRPFQIGPDETVDLVLTISRGSAEYNYDSIGIFMVSSCMFDHSEGLGYDISNVADSANYDSPDQIPYEGPYRRSDLNKFYKEYRLNVEFIEPCTPIDINSPRQDWVVTPDDNNRLPITIFGYQADDPDLDTVRYQYRLTGGDGNWINILKLPADSLAGSIVNTEIWNMEQLRDGPYEIRATATCKDLNLAPGISSVIKGRKETQAPKPLGTPEPADGVLNPGDEISITYTKRINCGLIFPADGIGTNININNLALIDKTTGELIDATISCREDKIVIVPNVPRRFIENRNLGVVANDIQDLYGNESDSIHWEFFVNQSNLYWDGGRIDETVLEGNKLTVTRQIRNQSGEITSYTIPSVPQWMQVFPRAGTLSPGDRQTVTFEFPADLLADAYATTLIMNTVDGEEPLPIELRVTCEGPNWHLDPGAFSFSSNLTVELDIEGVLSDDRVDRIGAFVDGELRGVANIRRFDEISGSALVNPNLAFLTVYSNVSSGETIDFQIWDASACQLYGRTFERIPFVVDGIEGEPLNPLTIHTTGELLRKIYLNPGWNWFSYNVNLPDNSVNATLESLAGAAAGATLKGQGAFSIYSEDADLWFGNLTETNVTSMYQFRSMAKDSLTLIGTAVDATQPIPIRSGWNWIGYLPNRGLPVTTALSSLQPLNGDIIKNQLSFSQYVAGVGWVGNLKFMSSPNGYLLRLSNAGTLRYPDPNLNAPIGQSAPGGEFVGSPGKLSIETAARLKSLDSIAPHWSVNPANYELSMNMVAVVAEGTDNLLLEEGDEIAAFVGDELRGADRVIYIPQLGRYFAFLTVFATEPGETVTYRFYDRSRDEEINLAETTGFITNDVIGLVNAPFVFNLGTTAVTGEDLNLPEDVFVYPNPARTVANISFSTDVGSDYTLVIRDVVGRELYHRSAKAGQRENVIQWDTDDVPDGIYFISLERDGALRTAKVQVKR